MVNSRHLVTLELDSASIEDVRCDEVVLRGGFASASPGSPCRASYDVTLSDTFNALSQPTELGMIALFAF